MEWLKRRYAVAIIAYCAVIFLMSAQSQSALADVALISFPGGDKTAHALLFGGLASLVSVGLRRSRDAVPPATQLWVPLCFATLYGLSDEVHQLYVPERTFEMLDWAADAGGALVAQLYFCGWRWKTFRGGGENEIFRTPGD